MCKRITLLFLVLTILFSLAGCGLISTPGIADNSIVSSAPTAAQERKERVVAEATEYLKENYPDDEFTYVSGRSPDWAYPYYELAFTTKKYDDQEFTVYGVYPNGEATDVEIPYFPEINTEQEFEYYDTYYQYYMKEDAEKYFTDLGNEYIGGIETCDVFFQGEIYSSKYINKAEPFSTNLELGNINVRVGLKTDKVLSYDKKEVKKLLEYLLEKKIYTSVWVKYKGFVDEEGYEYVRYTTYNGIVKEVE